MAVVPAGSVVKLDSGVVPTAPANVVVPEETTFRLNGLPVPEPLSSLRVDVAFALSVVPVVVTVLVLIAVVPLTDRVLRPVTVSVAASPNTALPVIARLVAPPLETVSRNVAVVAVMVVGPPRVTLSP